MCSCRGHGVECTDYCNCDPSKCVNTDGSPSALINEDLDTVKPLKTATLRGMQKWPSYRGGRLMEHLLLSTIDWSELLKGVKSNKNIEIT